MHLGTYKYNTTTEIGNADYNVLPFMDQIAEFSNCRKYPLYRIFNNIIGDSFYLYR